MGKIIRFPIIVLTDKADETQPGITPQLRSEIRPLSAATTKDVASEAAIRKGVDSLVVEVSGQNLNNGLPVFNEITGDNNITYNSISGLGVIDVASNNNQIYINTSQPGNPNESITGTPTLTERTVQGGIEQEASKINYSDFNATTGVGLSGFPAFLNPQVGDVIGKILIKCTEKFDDSTTQFSIGTSSDPEYYVKKFNVPIMGAIPPPSVPFDYYYDVDTRYSSVWIDSDKKLTYQGGWVNIIGDSSAPWQSVDFGQASNYNGTIEINTPGGYTVDNISKISFGNSNLFIIFDDNSLWGMGENRTNIMGIGNNGSENANQVRVLTHIADDVKDIDFNWHGYVAGSYWHIRNHSAGYIKTNGDLYVCGYNNLNTIGTGVQSTYEYQYVKIDNLSNVKKFYSPGYSGNASRTTGSYAILENGEVWGCGLNNNGVLGIGSTANNVQSTFVKLPNMDGEEIVKLARSTSQLTVLALTKSGKVFGWGHNQSGCLGTGDTTTVIAPVLIYDNSSDPAVDISITQAENTGYRKVAMIQTTIGRLLTAGYNNSHLIGRAAANGGANTTFEEIDGNLNVKKFWCLNSYGAWTYGATIVQTVDNKLYSWGSSSYVYLLRSATSTTDKYPVEITGLPIDVSHILTIHSLGEFMETNDHSQYYANGFEIILKNGDRWFWGANAVGVSDNTDNYNRSYNTKGYNFIQQSQPSIYIPTTVTQE